jgi:hypothetical protein
MIRTYFMARKLRTQYEHKYCKINQIFTCNVLIPFGLVMAVYMSRNMLQNNISI